MLVLPRARKVFGDAINSSIATILQWRPKRVEFASVSSPDTSVGQADLLTGRMTAFGLDACTVACVEPVTFRKLLSVCATCGWHGLCRWDLQYDPIDVASRKYCPNSAMLSALAPMASSLNEWRAPLTLF
jgi:hypothetical protein